MAAIDAVWEFSSADAIGASAYSENHIDLGASGVSPFQIGNLFLNCILTRGAGTSLTSIDVILRCGTGTDGTDINAGIYELMSRLTLHTDRAIDTTGNGLVLMSQSMPLGITARYVQVYYTLDTLAGAGLLIDCYLGLHPLNPQVSIQQAPA